jgi:hypothetical protein
MVENRLYARTEGSLAGGDQGTGLVGGKSDGRGLEGRLSYFGSGLGSESENDRENADERQRFGQGLVGLERGRTHQWLLYGSVLERQGGRPGKEIAGEAEDPNFRSEFEGWEGHLVERVTTGLRSHLTVKVGTRTSEVEDRNPDSLLPDPATAVDLKPYLRLATRVEERLAEARWDGAVSGKDRVTVGAAWRDEERRITGDVGIDEPAPGGGTVFTRRPFRVRDDVTRRTFYTEWRHRAGDRFDFKLGGYLDRPSGADSLVLPKVVARYRPKGRSFLVFLAYPTFLSDATELSPVEAWAQPFGFDRLGFTEDGWAMSYELHYERPLSRLGLLSLSAFTRNAHGLLLDLEDPRFAPAPNRLLVQRARVSGAQAAYEHALTRTLTGRVFARWQESEDRGSENELPYFPEWQGGVRLDYLDRAGWESFVAVTYVGKRFTDGANATELGGFVVVSARVARQLDLRRYLFVAIENVLDREYEVFAGYPASGRRFVAGMEYRF